MPNLNLYLLQADPDGKITEVKNNFKIALEETFPNTVIRASGVFAP